MRVFLQKNRGRLTVHHESIQDNPNLRRLQLQASFLTQITATTRIHLAQTNLSCYKLSCLSASEVIHWIRQHRVTIVDCYLTPNLDTLFAL